MDCEELMANLKEVVTNLNKQVAKKNHLKTSLKDSKSFYNPIIELELFYVLLIYSKDSVDSNKQRLYSTLNKVYSERDCVISNIVTLNIGFMKLLEIAELGAALLLIWLQTNNLKHFYVEYKYFNRVLYNIYEKGLVWNQIKVKGENIKFTDMLNELDDKLGGFTKI